MKGDQMVPITELDVMKSIDEALSNISEPTTRDRILKWAWAKFSPMPLVAPADDDIKPPKKTGIPKKKIGKKSTKVKSALTLVKEMNLIPKGKKSFEAFAKEKSPSSNPERCVVCVYYIINELGQGPVSTNHVYTCFKSQWPVPANLENTLQWAASQKAWLDTSNMTDIKMAPQGDNLIEHKLPKKKESK
jgi:hypothetical protein